MGAFKNLALHNYRTTENNIVKNELVQAKIPYIKLPCYMVTEVKTAFIGVLNGFVFTRSWNYWSCKGDMPLDDAINVAQNMGLIGITAVGEYGSDIDGLIGCCPILKKKEEELMSKLTEQNATSQEIFTALHKLQTEADPAWPRFVPEHHLDTAEGLAALAEYIKTHNIYACNGDPAGYAASVYPNPAEEG